MSSRKLGIWGLFSHLNVRDFTAFARTTEAQGYATLWLPEAFGRDLFVAASLALADTEKLEVATGVATTYARDALATVNAQYGLAEQSGGRFLLGLGVSHRGFVEQVRGHRYTKPLGAMKDYLDAMAKAQFLGIPPTDKPKTLLAALGPKMLELAATLADGAHTYNVTPEHTALARAILGPHKLLCVEQMVILERDSTTARTIGRRMLVHSVDLDNYRANFLRMGFKEPDLANGGSDKLIDSIIAWGDEETIRARIQRHWDAGADQVCIQSLPREGVALGIEDRKVYELLAPGGRSSA